MSFHLHLQWNDPTPSKSFRTGVSLHGHTLHSRESLDFIYRAGLHFPPLAAALRQGERRYEQLNGVPLDLSRGWWTPPLGPLEAWSVETSQIHNLDFAPLVSLTDHDDIEAPMALQLLDQSRSAAISLEWTVPFQNTFFHFGIHNLARTRARGLFEDMMQYRRKPAAENLCAILCEIGADPGTLVVFNHPLWDERGIGRDGHAGAVRELLNLAGEYIHAVELNGMRSWRENRNVIALAEASGKPAISGGDRHALEPNTLLNMTNVQCFAEFAEQVRGGSSEVLVLQHYREPHVLRLVHNILDVLKTYEQHAKGWRLWSDRVFYARHDGAVRSLSELFTHGMPAPVGLFMSGVRFASLRHVQQMLRFAFSKTEEVTL